MRDIIGDSLRDFDRRFGQINRTNLLVELMYLHLGHVDPLMFDQLDKKLRRRETLPCEEQAELIYEDQKRACIMAGFPEQLGLSSESYAAQLPEFDLPSQEILTRFPIPILVEPRVRASWQTRGMDNDFEPQDSIDSIINTMGIVTPSTPYLLWVYGGKRYRGYWPDVSAHLIPDERPLTFIEGLALYRARPEIFFKNRKAYSNEGFGISLAGSIAADGGIPYIYHNYYLLQEFGEFQIMSIWSSLPNYTGGWPTCWTGL